MQRMAPRLARLARQGLPRRAPAAPLSPRCWANPGAPPRRHSSSGTAVLSQTTSFLRNLDNGAEIFLVGTAHVSRRSADEVRDMITLVRPDVVLLELCPQRAARLRQGQASDAEFLREALAGFAAPGANFGQNLFKLSMQGMYRMLHSIGMDVGGEFKAAMAAAEAQGARVVYGDRDVQETMAALAAAVRLEDLLRMMTTGGGPQPPQEMVDFFENGGGGGSNGGFSSVGGRLEAQVEAMKTRAMARSMSQWLRQLNPRLAAALIDERDEHLTQSLRKLKGRVVGVVGLAHLDGIERRWEAKQPGSVVAPPVPKLTH